MKLELDSTPIAVEQLKSVALTNYGHFTSMLVDEQHRVRGLRLHLERLRRDCMRVFDYDLDPDQVRRHVKHALQDVAEPTVVRVTVVDPALTLGTIGRDATARIMVTTRPAPTQAAPPLRLQAAVGRRESPQIKHIGLFSVLQSRRAAIRDGFDDVVLVDPDGHISEIATSNIAFITSDDDVVWPQAEVLRGVTMTLLQQAADVEMSTRPLTMSDVRDMRGAFATNAATGPRAVGALDDITFRHNSTILDTLQQQYEEIPGERL